jgi:hypothetical protein
MNTTTPHHTDAPPRSATPRPIDTRRQASASPEPSTWGDLFHTAAPLIDAPAFYGPPVIFVLGPWLLLVLVLIGPFAAMITIVFAMAVVAGLLAAVVAVIASPYLLIRHLRSHGVGHAKPRAPRHRLRNRRVSYGRLGSLQPKGVS